MKLDCDQDAIVVLVDPTGPSCHHGTKSCFEEDFYQSEVSNTQSLSDYTILLSLEKIIKEREES
ncbi:phosphoribosyl-AMP cyclohydrolase, partial [Escherichia coli]|uniref:phosphoribosyl-AMP cyclohydrolase n=1 Tax=Escherichia coli TaxID=562 RepID=UPI0024DEF404